MSTAVYKSYSEGDKKALTEIREYMAAKLSLKSHADIKISDAIQAVEPDLVTPTNLVGL